MARNWRHSLEKVAELRGRLASDVPGGVRTIALAGSFGRFEASDQSDADAIIIVEDGADDTVGDEAVAVVTRHIAEMGILEPNPRGVFNTARKYSEILPPEDLGRLGDAQEEMDVLGKRMLMLLESRPLFNDDEYERCVSAIFDRYARYVGTETTKEHVLLLNDLIRYFRFICINYQSNFERENEKWPLRNVKLRHSRIIMYMGLLVLLGESSKHTDQKKLSLVRNRLHLTPLDRIAAVYQDNNDTSFFRVAGAYETFLRRISDEELRDELNDVAYEQRYANTMFSTLKTNSDALQAELTRFILTRRGQWSERFFEYLLF
jgi:hypothetical protein